MKLTNYSWLQPTEYTFITLSAMGTVVAAVTQQAIYATLPLTLALSLNINNSKRLQQQTKSAIAEINQVKQDLNHQRQCQEIDELNQVAEQLKQQFEEFVSSESSSLASLTCQVTKLQQSVSELKKDGSQESSLQTQNELQALQEENEQQTQRIEKLQLRYQAVGYLSSEIRDIKQQKRQESYQFNQKLEELDAKIHQLSQNETIKENSQILEPSSHSDKFVEPDTHQYLLNNFEELVLTELQQHFPQQAILTQFDVGRGNESSKVIDFAVIMPNCIVLIEAKSYEGKIVTQGEPRNNSWFCQKNNQMIKINACWGANPYKQVKVYVDSFLQLIRNMSTKSATHIPVYGIVVFPKETQISSDITNGLGGFYKVTTLNKLARAIQTLNTHASYKGGSKSYHNILKIVTGTHNKSAA